MVKHKGFVIAAKCAPCKGFLSDIKRSGLEAVELYLSRRFLGDLNKIIGLCRRYSFRYAVHAPNDYFNIDKLKKIVDALAAEIVVFHNIYWEGEWEAIVRAFRDVSTRLCLENTYSVHEPVKFMRRYGIGRCLDLEHLQLECAGIYEEEFIRVIKEAAHIHLTGYIYGSRLWHTHLHHSERHAAYFLDLLKKAGYSGLVVSEAKQSLQNYREFKRLNDFYLKWKAGAY